SSIVSLMIWDVARLRNQAGAVRHARKLFSGIGEIGHAEIEIDICDLRADTACHGELTDWLGRQLDGGHRGSGGERERERERESQNLASKAAPATKPQPSPSSGGTGW